MKYDQLHFFIHLVSIVVVKDSLKKQDALNGCILNIDYMNLKVKTCGRKCKLN